MEATANKNITAAAVDLGSNSFRLLIAGHAGGRIIPLSQKMATVRLGEGLSGASNLSQAAMDRAVAVLKDFRTELSKYTVDRCRFCGTESLRKADNSTTFIEQATALLNGPVEVISGRKEAELNNRGVIASISDEQLSFPLITVNVGGNSTEVTLNGTISSRPASSSFNAGATLFTEMAEKETMGSAMASFITSLKDLLSHDDLSSGITLVSSGGTATAMAAIDLGLEHYDGDKVQGHFLGTNKIAALSERLSVMSAKERCFLPGLDQGRGDIILAGIEIYKEIIATIGVEGMIVSNSGLLEGILLSCIDD